MTHFERNEGEQKEPILNKPSEEKHHEHKVHEEHKQHKSHAEHKRHEHKPHKKECCKGLSSFQKFLAAAVIIQLILLLFIIAKLPSGAVVDNVEDNLPTVNPPSAPSAPTVVADMEELIDDDHVNGDDDAPVTIVEWSDFECPFCTRFYNDAYQQIKSEYVDTGKVKFVYRDFPLSFHPNAQKAAEAAECAGEQDKYFEMHDLMFEQGVSGGVTSYKSYAQRLGLDTAEFNSCLDSGEMAGEVRKDFADGQAAGISGTPGFIVNGRLISGAQPFAAFQQAIEAALN